MQAETILITIFAGIFATFCVVLFFKWREMVDYLSLVMTPFTPSKTEEKKILSLIKNLNYENKIKVLQQILGNNITIDCSHSAHAAYINSVCILGFVPKADIKNDISVG